MNKSIVLRVLCAAVVLATLASAPESVLAQRGGHGGGGGFHGGGGGFHGGGWGGGGHYGGGFHGGGYGGYHGGGYYGGRGGHYGGYHGGGYYGGHGGYYGGRGGYWGYPGYGYGGWGFGFGLSFDFGGPYWGYAYPYGYATVYAPPYYPYYYAYPPYYVSVPASDPSGDYSAANYRTGSDVRVNSPVEASTPVARPPVLRGTPGTNSPTMNYAAYTPTAPGRRTDATTTTSSNYRSPHSAAQPLPPLRAEVQNVIRALRGMPPDARQREIDSGQYSNLSPQELKLAKYEASLPPVRGNPAVGAPLRTN